MKLGRNGRLFYRWCTLDPGRSTFSMHIKGQIVEYLILLVKDMIKVTRLYFLIQCLTYDQRRYHTDWVV